MPETSVHTKVLQLKKNEQYTEIITNTSPTRKQSNQTKKAHGVHVSRDLFGRINNTVTFHISAIKTTFPSLRPRARLPICINIVMELNPSKIEQKSINKQYFTLKITSAVIAPT